MLYTIGRDGPVEITVVPHVEVFDQLRDRLSAGQFKSIRDEISRRIDGLDPFNSSRIGEGDWDGTPLQAIREVACPGDFELAGQFFGLIVWYHMMKHPDAWSFQQVDKVDKEEGGKLYFRIKIPQ